MASWYILYVMYVGHFYLVPKFHNVFNISWPLGLHNVVLTGIIRCGCYAWWHIIHGGRCIQCICMVVIIQQVKHFQMNEFLNQTVDKGKVQARFQILASWDFMFFCFLSAKFQIIRRSMFALEEGGWRLEKSRVWIRGGEISKGISEQISIEGLRTLSRKGYDIKRGLGWYLISHLKS